MAVEIESVYLDKRAEQERIMRQRYERLREKRIERRTMSWMRGGVTSAIHRYEAVGERPINHAATVQQERLSRIQNMSKRPGELARFINWHALENDDRPEALKEMDGGREVTPHRYLGQVFPDTPVFK